MIYYGPNKMEHWQRSIQRPPSRVTLRNTRQAFRDADNLAKQAQNFDSTKWADRGAAAGGLIAAGLYSLSYPITFVDGPLPFVDAAWLYGLYRTTRTGSEIGRTAGSWLD